MRTPLLAAALGLTLVGCLVGGSDAPGPGAADDDDGAGGGSQKGSDKPILNPRVDVTVDKTTSATELGKDDVVTLTLTSVDEFAGDVTVTPSLVDGAGAALAGGMTVVGQPKVTLTANGTATAAYTVKVPSNASGADVAATLKFDVSSSVGSKQLTSAVAIAAVYTVTYAAGLAGDVATHPERAKTITVKKGTKIRFHNADTVSHITHGEDSFPHESTNVNVGGLPTKTYEVNTAGLAAGNTGKLGCHSHGSGTYATFIVQ